MWIAATTQQDALRDRRSLIEAKNEEGETVFSTFEVGVGADDPAEGIFLELHPDETSRLDRAEREAIAWALVHGTKAVFVTLDLRACFTALAELGRARVCHPLDLWLELLDARLLTKQQFGELCHATHLKDQGLERMPDRVRERMGDPGQA